MIVKDGKEVYPLRRSRVQLGEKLIYDLPRRGKSWFILDLALPTLRFVPSGATGMITADGGALVTKGRRTGKDE